MNPTDKRYTHFLDLVLSHLGKRDLCACSLVNKTWSQLARSKIWYQPEFGTEGLTSFQAFQIFVKILTKVASEQTKALIQVIDISQVQESLYETLNDNWLTIIIRHCSNLRSLIIRDASCLTSKAVRELITNYRQAHNSLQYLNLENSKNITENLLKSFIQKFPELLAINLNNCSGVSDSSISQISYYCHDLNTIELSNAGSRTTDVSIYAISKFGKHKLRKLDFSSIQKITDNSINVIANHCKHLEVMNLSNCSQLITCRGLTNLLMANKNSLKELWIHNVKGIPWLTKDLWELITIKCNELELLSISFNTITSSPNTSSSLAGDSIFYYFSQFKKLKNLILYNVSEFVSTKFLQNLIECCGIGGHGPVVTEGSSKNNGPTRPARTNGSTLKEVLIYRVRYERDFILGGYAKPKSSTSTNDYEESEIGKEDVFNEEWANKFNSLHPNGPKVKLLLYE